MLLLFARCSPPIEVNDVWYLYLLCASILLIEAVLLLRIAKTRFLRTGVFALLTLLASTSIFLLAATMERPLWYCFGPYSPSLQQLYIWKSPFMQTQLLPTAASLITLVMVAIGILLYIQTTKGLKRQA